MKEFLTAGDAAQVLSVTPAAVRAMADRGDLEVAATTESGIRLFDRDAVEHLAAKRSAEESLPPEIREEG